MKDEHFCIGGASPLTIDNVVREIGFNVTLNFSFKGFPVKWAMRVIPSHILVVSSSIGVGDVALLVGNVTCSNFKEVLDTALDGFQENQAI